MELEFAQDPSGETGTVTDVTPANTYPSPYTARGDAANYLLFSKTDKNGVRTFHNPDFGSVLSVTSWDVDTAVSGLYEAILLRVGPYDNGASYVEEQSSGGEITQYASIVYYPSTDKVYKAIAAGSGNIPTNTSFWEEVADLSDIIDNTNIDQEILNINSDKLIDKCIAALFAKSGCNCSTQDAETKNQLMGRKRSAEVNFASGNVYEYEKIIEQLNATCPQCS
jgi:hypothetical protein